MPHLKSSLPIEVLIISFDGYADVWDLCISSFFKFWPDCPFKINLLTNWKQYPDERIRSLCVGQDEDWSSNLTKGLQAVNSPYVLTLFDDLILKERIDNDKIIEFVRTCILHQYNYFRLRPSPPPDGKEFLEYGSLKPGASYRVSLCTAIVKTETLLSLLLSGENAWDFEKYASLRSAHLSGFYSARQHVIPYYNAIEKGKWNKSVLPILKERRMSWEHRGIFQKREKFNPFGPIKHFIVFTIMPVYIRKLFYHLQKKLE
ncbi:MAG: hypothetical protein WAT91_02915 [Saprospiraceae bacterium]